MESIQKPKPDPNIRPLTHRTKKGRSYQRPKEIESQIRWALTLEAGELLRFAHLIDSSEPKYLKEETLVYLILAYRRAGNSDMVNDLSDELVKRITPLYGAFFHGFTATQRAEAGDELLKGMFIKIINDMEGKGDFFQIRFWACLKRLATSIFLEKAKGYNRETVLVPLSDLAGYEMEDPYSNPDDEFPSERPSELTVGTSSVEDIVFDKITARDGLKILPEPLRTAYLLYYEQGWDIESKDPTEPTISKYYNVTPRTVRNWLTRAEESLETWRGGSHGKSE